MEDNDIEFTPFSKAHLPSWWKHTKEGEEVMRQLAALQAQVAVAVEGLRILSELGGGRSDGNRIAQETLTKISTTLPGNWVTVRRDDLETVLYLEDENWRESTTFNRLKAALAGREE